MRTALAVALGTVGFSACSAEKGYEGAHENVDRPAMALRFSVGADGGVRSVSLRALE